jgi:hypothetical protein
LKELPLPVDGNEKIRENPDGFGRTQKKDTSRLETVMKKGQKSALQISIKIDEEVPAGDEIEPGKGGVFDDILDSENDVVPDVLTNPEPSLFEMKKTIEPFRSNIMGNTCRVVPCPCQRNGLFIDIRPKNLDLEIPLLSLDVLLD